jgi:hypothetical protein
MERVCDILAGDMLSLEDDSQVFSALCYEVRVTVRVCLAFIECIIK